VDEFSGQRNEPGEHVYWDGVSREVRPLGVYKDFGFYFDWDGIPLK
jgi:hypothetical protein